MEKRFIESVPVLDKQGRPNAGWASSGILHYDRRAIKAPFYRIKEWDWYQVSNSRLALQFTYGHASYAGQVGVTFFDFSTGEKIFTKDILLAAPFGSLKLGASADADGTLCFDRKNFRLRIETDQGNRAITCDADDFSCAATMTRKNPNALVINVPFDESPTCFYYNHKINCMEAAGTITVGGREFTFEPADSWGLLDWGRGVWPFHNEWYWSNASGRLDGEVFGFNLGCGFGNTGIASENCLFYKNEIHKLGQVRIERQADVMQPWRLRDAEGRLDLTLEPIYDRESAIKMLWVNNHCDQMFGTFSGSVVLDDGTRLAVRDIIGFAEHAVNNW